jgi:hypothetical protein
MGKPRSSAEHWRQTGDGQWTLFAYGMTLARVHLDTTSRQRVWVGVVPPRTAPHLGPSPSLQCIMQKAELFLRQRPSVAEAVGSKAPVDQTPEEDEDSADTERVPPY